MSSLEQLYQQVILDHSRERHGAGVLVEGVGATWGDGTQLTAEPDGRVVLTSAEGSTVVAEERPGGADEGAAVVEDHALFPTDDDPASLAPSTPPAGQGMPAAAMAWRTCDRNGAASTHEESTACRLVC